MTPVQPETLVGWNQAGHQAVAPAIWVRLAGWSGPLGPMVRTPQQRPLLRNFYPARDLLIVGASVAPKGIYVHPKTNPGTVVRTVKKQTPGT